MLDGYGDATLGEWPEFTGRAFHLRRRLTATEQRQVGDVLDVRGTPEAERRLQVVMRELPTLPEALIREADKS